MAITTDTVIAAASATRDVYLRNGRKLYSAGHVETSAAEMRRAAIMNMLASDENLCSMLAGELNGEPTNG